MSMYLNKTFKSTFAPALLLAGALSIAAMTGCANSSPSTQKRTNLALGKKVLFSPAPSGNKADNAGLTDGKILEHPEQPIWLNSSLAKWSYAGRFNLAVDLGQSCDIDEIAIRLLNGSPTYTTNSGRMFPGWVEVFVSNDGENYTEVTEFSRWNPGEFDKFGIGQERDTSWMDTLRFKDLNARGRWVGLRIYGNSRTASDELYVFGTPSSNAATTTQKTDSGFTVNHPQIYFNKPYLELANNIPLPVPIGVTVPSDSGADVTLDIDLPPGLKIVSGDIAKIDVASIKVESLSEGWQRYSFPMKNVKTRKDLGRLFLQATSWKDGQDGELRYRFGDQKWQSPELAIPIRAVHVPAAPQLKTIMTSLGWWNDINPSWPEQPQALKTIGINTLSVLTGWGVSAKAKSAAATAKDEGFFVSAIESPFHVYLRELKKEHKDEIFDQFANGKVGTKLCICYRGKYYQQEIDRIAKVMADVEPNFISMDNEQWGNDGPVASKKCVRCQTDYKASGFKTWEEWQQAKGAEIVTDLANGIRKVMKAKGAASPKIGSYNVSPEHVYQQVYNFEDLYPKILDVSEGSTYSSLQPADLAFIGKKVRDARAKMTRSDVMPWITPGDAGTFPGDAFQWALLECYANGSRGIWFWSNRVWDSEDLIAYNRVIRAIAPVEEIVVDGDLVGASATVEGPGRVSGMKLRSRMVLLAADYFNKSDGTLKLHLTLPVKSHMRDLLTGKTVGETLAAGSQTVSIPLNGKQARLLEVVPVK